MEKNRLLALILSPLVLLIVPTAEVRADEGADAFGAVVLEAPALSKGAWHFTVRLDGYDPEDSGSLYAVSSQTLSSKISLVLDAERGTYELAIPAEPVADQVVVRVRWERGGVVGRTSSSAFYYLWADGGVLEAMDADEYLQRNTEPDGGVIDDAPYEVG